MSISSLQARAQQWLQHFFSTPSPSGPIIDAWHLFSLVRAMWTWMIRPLLWVFFSFPFKFTWWLMKARDSKERDFNDEFYELQRLQNGPRHRP